jgi:hypothetical protein
MILQGPDALHESATFPSELIVTKLSVALSVIEGLTIFVNAGSKKLVPWVTEGALVSYLKVDVTCVIAFPSESFASIVIV